MAAGKALARRCVMDIMHNALNDSLSIEISKGCSSEIFPNSVPLEPPFHSYRLTDFMRNDECIPDEEPETILDTKERKETVFLRIWYPMDHKLNWKESESLLREFTVLTDRCAFEIIGNKTKIITQFALDIADAVPVKNAIKARFPKLRIECHRENHLESYEKGLIGNDLRDDYEFDLHDYYPLPPYFRNMTIFQGTDSSPLASIYAAFSEVNEDELACFQVLFLPTDESHNWGQNIINLIEA